MKELKEGMIFKISTGKIDKFWKITDPIGYDFLGKVCTPVIECDKTGKNKFQSDRLQKGYVLSVLNGTNNDDSEYLGNSISEADLARMEEEKRQKRIKILKERIEKDTDELNTLLEIEEMTNNSTPQRKD